MHANMRIVLSIYVFPAPFPHARATQVYVCMYVGCYVWIVVRHFPRCPKTRGVRGDPFLCPNLQMGK